MITGQSPRQQWRPNPGRQTRTIEEAVAIARRFGVVVPDDVAFSVDEFGLLDKDMMAAGPRIAEPIGAFVSWSDLVHDRTGKVPFVIRPEILKSDEAIVAVIAHEMYELEHLRVMLERGPMTIQRFVELTRPGNRGNLHDQAWDVSDQMVERMRREKP